MTYGSVIASFNVEEFGTERVARLTPRGDRRALRALPAHDGPRGRPRLRQPGASRAPVFSRRKAGYDPARGRGDVHLDVPGPEDPDRRRADPDLVRGQGARARGRRRHRPRRLGSRARPPAVPRPARRAAVRTPRPPPATPAACAPRPGAASRARADPPPEPSVRFQLDERLLHTGRGAGRRGRCSCRFLGVTRENFPATRGGRARRGRDLGRADAGGDRLPASSAPRHEEEEEPEGGEEAALVLPF